ncbi:MAG: ABC transporter substrate-binding protein/permease [Acidobacteriota bacterium]|nr:ABC transporter substrate-binding protein/permease [Acidobacteriota bacterium]
MSRGGSPAATLCALLLLSARPTPAAPRSAPEPKLFLWGGDAEGGAPFVEADPRDPSVVRGMDVEIAAVIARKLGLEARFVQVTFTSIDASVERGDFALGLSGVEDLPARRAAHAVTVPYFEFREVLTVRERDRARFRTLLDFRGRRVGTLGGTLAYEVLLSGRRTGGYEVVSYDDDVHPYGDLAEGRLDGVVLDHIIAQRAARRVPGLVLQPDPLATGWYVGVLAKRNSALRDRIDGILMAAMREGTLEGILRRWNVWDENQPKLFARVLEGRPERPLSGGTSAPAGPTSPSTGRARALTYVPALLRAAVITLLLSCLAMALAVAAGILLASGRIYGGSFVRALFTAYVEIVRGTPLLLQLFVLYYGLSAVVRLPAFAAALLGLGLNYAAYESEIYRGALEAVSRTQLEAARTLGLSEWLILRLVRGPQAFRLALAPMTNDFVALLKDSSLVSVITVVELTKQTSILAANIGSWVLPGAICAALYLAMSLPLSRLARALERRWSASR